MGHVKDDKDFFDDMFDVDGNAICIVLAWIVVVFVVCLAL
jgi:hypothetical protein